jgi:hypothetical protein
LGAQELGSGRKIKDLADETISSDRARQFAVIHSSWSWEKSIVFFDPGHAPT